MDALIIFILLLVFLFLRVPIAFSTGLVVLCYIIFSQDLHLPVKYAALGAFGGLDMFTMLAVPFFIFAGQIMARGGIAKHLLRLADILLGALPGGYALSTVLGSVFFGDLSGSAAATVSAIGTIMVPGMTTQGYNKYFATAVAACAGCLAVIIPPSNPMILFGVATDTSIGQLFLAGFGPGLIVAIALMIPAYFISKKNGWAGRNTRKNWRDVLLAFWDAKYALMVPIIILGGIYSGIFTPTEAGAVACLYALLAGRYGYKEFTWKQLPELLLAGINTIVPIMVIISIAVLFGEVISVIGIPMRIAEHMRTMTDNPIILLILINIFLLFVGMFMELGAAIVILAPILMPLVHIIGINPVHFGLIMIVNLSIGFITPPLGTNLFIASSIGNVRSEYVFLHALPFVLSMIIALAIITIFPQTCLWLPSLFYNN